MCTRLYVVSAGEPSCSPQGKGKGNCCHLVDQDRHDKPHDNFVFLCVCEVNTCDVSITSKYYYCLVYLFKTLVRVYMVKTKNTVVLRWIY